MDASFIVSVDEASDAGVDAIGELADELGLRVNAGLNGAEKCCAIHNFGGHRFDVG